MTRYDYTLIDVFTDRVFGGNPLAVFPRADGLDTETMQAIGGELNLSESAFVFPTETEGHAFRVRFFTPDIELPMAGHPTVGTAYVLAREGMITGAAGSTTAITFEQGVGSVPVEVAFDAHGPQSILMRQPLPQFGPEFPNVGLAAELLSLNVTDFMPGLPLRMVSTGVPFLYFPIRDLEAIGRIKVRLDLWDAHFKDWATPHLFAFTMETTSPDVTVHSRMFAPAMGISEDPATGAASGPLGAYLVQYGLVDEADARQMVSEQGVEMGRRSLITIDIRRDAARAFTGVTISGGCVFVGAGYLEI